MKKLLTLTFLVAGAASLASASTISNLCQGSGTGLSGTVGEVCTNPGIASIPLGSIFQSITMIAKFDASFTIGAGSGTVDENFNVTGYDNGGAFDHLAFQTVTDTTSPIFTAPVTQLNPTAADVLAVLTSQAVTANWQNGGGSIGGETISQLFTVTYTSAAPEPATLGLLGSALVGLGFLARRKK